MKFGIGVCGEKVQCLSKGFCFWAQNRLRKVFLYSVATPPWLPPAKGSLPQHFNRTTGLRRLSSLINDQNTSANENFAGCAMPKPAGLETQLVLNSLYLEIFFPPPLNEQRCSTMFWTLIKPSAPHAKSAHPDACSENSSLYKNSKKRENSCGQRGNGLRRETEEAFVDVVSSATLRYLSHRGARYSGRQCFSCFLLSPSQATKAPLTWAPFFFVGRSTQSFLYYAATVRSWETQAVVLVHLCNARTLPSPSSVVIQPQRSHLPPESSGPFHSCWAECLTLCWIFTWPLTESFRRHRWTPAFRCSCMSQHKWVKLQSQTPTRRGGESLPQGRSALIPEHRTCSLPDLSLDGSDGGLFGGTRVCLPADVRACMER